MMRIISTRNGRPQLLPVKAVAVTLSALAAHVPSALAGTPKAAEKLPPAASARVDFKKDIQPLFEGHCYKCHGPEKQESGLRLDDADLALKGGDLGPAYVPGKSADS